MAKGGFIVRFTLTALLPILSLGLRLEQRRQGSDRVATLIAMEIRLPDSPGAREEHVRALNDVTRGTDVFVCTEKASKPLVAKLANVRRASFSHNATRFDPSLGVAGSHMGGNTIQWWRLQRCWGMLQKYEKENGLEYAFIVKLRTDCDRFGCLRYPASATDPLYAPDRTAFIHSDWQFGARRDTFRRIASLYSRIEKDYWTRDEEYVHIDWGLLRKCDLSAGKFYWLKFPRAAMGERPCFTPRCILRNEKLMAWASNHSKRDARRCETVSGKVFRNPGVASEKVLVLDLLRAGIAIQSFRRLGGSGDPDTARFFENETRHEECIDDSIDGDCLGQQPL